ncbi:MAG: hypothetical protein IPM29_03155 [Planctomycetes bacterium]|nr:hypothetical protein [Planctomycetota bacterium]
MSAPISAMVAVGPNSVMFSAPGPGADIEPWTTDGRRTRFVVDVASGGGSSNTAGFALLRELRGAGPVFFSAVDPTTHTELFAMPAALAGVAALEPISESSAPNARAVGLSSPPPVSGDPSFRIDLAGNQGDAMGVPSFGTGLLPVATAGLPRFAVSVSAGLMTHAGGRATLALTIPSDPALIGTRRYVVGGLARSGGSYAGLLDFRDVCALIVGE